MSLVAWQSAPRPGPGPEPEPCWRVRPQARRYLEQLRARLAPGPAGPAGPAPADYLVEAAAHLRLALERDAGEDYEAAFNHYQNSVDVLLRGVHVDPNKERCEAVKLKISKYLRRAEEIFTYHLDEGSGTGLSSLRLRPIRTLSSALEQLRSCRVIGVLGKVQLVRDPDSGGTFVVKSLPRSPEASRERLTIIPRGVPYMTKLLRYFVSEDSIFLHLEHVPGQLRLTFFSQWAEVEPQCCREAADKLYCAPEVGGITELTEACDWWSFGSLLYELLTGTALAQSHPSGIQPHTQLQLPNWLSGPAASLLTELLQFDPARRLGVESLRSHPFFSSVQWSQLLQAGGSPGS
ncbi:ribosomal protein S6 kinase-like 1 isoform X2 [Erinaceus europaeus]|uniref:Ribosomal protein S6 kinase-like 1 isoform X2 n=1 Tax=Erinaceus europaeus TaxID=9365 RepID=A0ABM3WL40_ERIEU|nr:ribosomal protein S6 kinase-like 1 isoform X2 [Erinaceus europaeus]